jgi:hypothetical protein
MRAITRAAAHGGTALAGATVHAPELARLRVVAERAINELGTGPLQPTGAVRDALAAGRLIRTGDPARLDALEHVLRTGTIDRSTAHVVGGGVNGPRSRYAIDSGTPTPVSAVEKPVDAQAAQEELAWKLGRELGIDHLMPAVARRANGDALIEFRAGTSLSAAGTKTVHDLDVALATSYLADAQLHLSPTEAAQAGRVDRQLLQFVDYLVANNDRHLTNGLEDITASGKVTFLDFGMMSRGALANGGSELRPTMRSFQGSTAAPHVDLDPDVVAYIRQRLTPGRIAELHTEVFEAAGIGRPSPGTLGEQLYVGAKGPSFRMGMQHRLDHVLKTSGYDHAISQGDELLDPKEQVDNRAVARGLGAVRNAFMDAAGGGW